MQCGGRIKMAKRGEQLNPAEPVEIEGKTIQDAIDKGLNQLGLKREEADIRILSEGTPGLFGLMGSRAAKISIRLKSAGGAPSSPFTAPKKVSEEIKHSINSHIAEIIKLMNISAQAPKITVESTETGFSANIDFQEAGDSSLLIGKGGKTLSSLGTIIQSVINNEFRGKIGDSPLPRISIDINQYRVQQEEKIKENVVRILETVRGTGKPFRMNPMTARLRRLVHITLQDNPEFESVSEGEGDLRRVVIQPRTEPLESNSK